MIYSYSAECQCYVNTYWSVVWVYLCIIWTIVYTIEAKCWFRFLLDLKYVAGAGGAWTDFLGAGASGEVSRAWDGFQQITKFSPHNDTRAIATWTRHDGLVTKIC